MIQLTQEQVQSLRTPEATPSRFVNPQTQEMYVLLPLAEYERLVEHAEMFIVREIIDCVRNREREPTLGAIVRALELL